jgi:sugar/nucleoside kinase (ribokinase family)
MMQPMPLDIAVVGHFSIDSIRLPIRPNPFIMLGGAAAYVSLVVKRLEGNVSIISRVGADFPKAYIWWLKEEGIDVSNVIKQETEKTTRFELEYSHDLTNRTLTLKSKGKPLGLDDLPTNLQGKAIHLAPIAGEITVEVAEHLKRATDIISFDPQGLLRKFNEKGKVSSSSLREMDLLSLVNVYKSSAEEIIILTGRTDLKEAMKAVHDYGVEIVIVTMGGKGALLSAEKNVCNIPACQSNALVDPTGAGDAFMGGFLIEFIRAKDLFWCGCVGSAAASFVVEGLGPTVLGQREEIYRRASTIYEK